MGERVPGGERGGGLRRFVPRPVRRAISAQLGHVDSYRLERHLADIAGSGRPVLAGPWLGEVGFELLYWAPFLAWFAERFAIAPERLCVLSRGGTARWYPRAGMYRDVLDYISPAEYRQQHHARERELGEQKQTRITAFEHNLASRVMADAAMRDAYLLHPSLIYHVLRRFWWGHADTEWIHGHTRYRRLEATPRSGLPPLPESYVAVKFYFNHSFPATESNRAFVGEVIDALAARGPVVSLSSGVELDDHRGCRVTTRGVLDAGSPTGPSRNLELQSAIVAHATAFVGTYGGFAYLAPFHGVRSISYYSDPGGFAHSHLRMALSAFDTMGAGDALHVHPVSGFEPSQLIRVSRSG